MSTENSISDRTCYIEIIDWHSYEYYVFMLHLESLYEDSDTKRFTPSLSPTSRFLKAKLACHPAMCLLPVEIIERGGLATGLATVELLPYLLPY